MAVRVDHAVVSGTFSLDGETFDVDNNIWVIGGQSMPQFAAAKLARFVAALVTL